MAMTDRSKIIRDLLSLSGELSNLAEAPKGGRMAGIPQAMSRLEGLFSDLTGHAETALAGDLDNRLIHSGVAAAQAAQGIEIGLCVLNNLRSVGNEDADDSNGLRAGKILGGLALQQCLTAIHPLVRAFCPSIRIEHKQKAGPLDLPDIDGVTAPAGAVPLDVLRNLVYFHRDHGRHNTAYYIELSADLIREANKLKVLADVWLGVAPKRAATYEVDYANPGFGAVSCEDLNAYSAIAQCGILFMEGMGKPVEIDRMVGKLRYLSAETARAGQFLRMAMRAAWVRDQVLFTPALIDIAETRFQVLIENWRTSCDLEMTGKLLERVANELDAMDMTPQALRRDPPAAGRKTRMIGWVLALAAQLVAKAGIEKIDDDPNSSDYAEFLEGVAGAG